MIYSIENCVAWNWRRRRSVHGNSVKRTRTRTQTLTLTPRSFGEVISIVDNNATVSLFFGLKLQRKNAKKIYSIEKALILNFIEWRMSLCTMLRQCVLLTCGCCWTEQSNSSKYCERFQMKFYRIVMLHSFSCICHSNKTKSLFRCRNILVYISENQLTQTKRREKKIEIEVNAFFHVHFTLHWKWLAVCYTTWWHSAIYK